MRERKEKLQGDREVGPSDTIFGQHFSLVQPIWVMHLAITFLKIKMLKPWRLVPYESWVVFLETDSVPLDEDSMEF